MDCDGEVLNSNPNVFGINELNYRTQNDFRFAIVSADDLDSEENSKKCPSVVEFFIQSKVTNKRRTLLGASSTLRFYFTQ